VPRSLAVAGRLIGLMAAFVAVSSLAGVLASGLVMPAAGATSSALASASDYFDSLPADLGTVPLPQRSVMLDQHGGRIATFYDENRVTVALTSVGPVMQQAIVAIEDSRFFQHGAVDPRGVIRAAVHDQAGGSTQGASTLTQQYVKNLLLERAVVAGDQQAAQAAVERSIGRKLREMKLAIGVEQRLTKPQILSGYLNVAFFGGRTYGVEAAAQRYFAVHASQLSLPQAATLAGMVQQPASYDPIVHPQAATERRNVVLTRMQQLNLIPPAAAARAAATKLKVHSAAPLSGCPNAGNDALFCDAVQQSIINGPGFEALGGTPQARQAALLQGGLTIRTTLDRSLQDASRSAVNRAVPPADPSGLGAASVTVEPGTGNVLALAENRVFSTQPGRGRTSVDYATDQNDGGSSGFQTGSTFKAFTLATWLSTGHSLSESVDATKRPFPFSDFRSCGSRLRASKPYTPGNSEGTETGQMSVLDATANSVNVAYVDMESQLDLCDLTALAERLGVHLAQPEQECSRTEPASTKLPTCLPALTLGVKQLAPLTMAAAYAAFADGGVYCRPVMVSAIQRAGRSVAVPGSSCTQAISRQVAAQVNVALRQVLTRGTAAAVGPLPGHDSAGKTGTTDGPYDSWFVGYTAQRSTAVWVADPGRVRNGVLVRRLLRGIRVAGSYHPTIFGATIAAPIWRNVMSAAMDGLGSQPLP
jgi:membrane peptidoglycan carboxypeptidase